MDNAEVIHNFYTVFAKGNADEMVSYYHPDVVFEDPVFGRLKGDEAGRMWRMLIARSKGNLKITFSDVKVAGNFGEAKWEAVYPFGSEKRLDHNKIQSAFECKEGKIIKQKDTFDLWKWAGMALGLKGNYWDGFHLSKIKSEPNLNYCLKKIWNNNSFG